MSDLMTSIEKQFPDIGDEAKKGLAKIITPMLERSANDPRKKQMEALNGLMERLRELEVSGATTKEIQDLITIDGSAHLFAPESSDDLALRRKIGDLLGSHGLRLESVVSDGVRYWQF